MFASFPLPLSFAPEWALGHLTLNGWRGLPSNQTLRSSSDSSARDDDNAQSIAISHLYIRSNRFHLPVNSRRIGISRGTGLIKSQASLSATAVWANISLRIDDYRTQSNVVVAYIGYRRHYREESTCVTSLSWASTTARSGRPGGGRKVFRARHPK